MQRATGQYDHLARVPRTGPRQSRGRRSFTQRHRCRTAPRRPRRMEPTDIEDVVVKFLKKYLAAKQDKSATSVVPLNNCDAVTQLVAGIIVHKDTLIVRLKSDNADDASGSPDDVSLSIPWQKPPSKRSRQILLPHNAPRRDVRPEQFERRARLVSAIARGRRWLDDVVSGRVTTVAELCAREKCSVRQLKMTISLSGTTLLAADRTGRRFRGLDIDPAYVDVAIDRWSARTGLEPRLEGPASCTTILDRRIH